nr:putative DNA binding domain-containing protein [Anaerolineae bacterium]
MSILPIRLDDLINGKFESIRLELKASWSKDVLSQVVLTICDFANDFLDLNGGFIVLGVAQDEETGLPILPPLGLSGNLDEHQKELFSACKRIDPEYIPIISVEEYQGKTILVIWCPPGQLRPYQASEKAGINGARGDYVHPIRRSNLTEKAKGETLTQLLQKTNQLPFDDRVNHQYTAEVISANLVRQFLSDAKIEMDVSSEKQRYRNLFLTTPINGHDAPRQVPLLMFVNNPEQYFSGARIEIVQFDDEGDTINTHILRGPLQEQVRQALNYLEGFSSTTIRKIPGQAQAQSVIVFPYDAMREAVVNAVCHRGYEGIHQQQPTLIRLYPDKMEIISYPGPLPSLTQTDFKPNSNPIPQHRNRRISEFFQRLKLAELYGTGISKIYRRMRENGSPEPRFDFDEAGSYFRVTLPAHPQYVVLHALRKSADLWAVGERQKAVQNLEMALTHSPHSGRLQARLIEYLAQTVGIQIAMTQVEIDERHLIQLAMVKAYLDVDDHKPATAILLEIQRPELQSDTLVDLDLLSKRAGNYYEAHKVFSDYYELFKEDPKAIHEYAQTKKKLAGQTRGDSRKRLNR